MNPFAPVSTIMTTELVKVSPETSFEEVKAIFKKHNFHHIPVLDSDEKLVGLISKTDLLISFENTNQQTAGKIWTQKFYAAVKAKDIMTKNLMVLEVEDSIGLAADIFLANQFHALPIVEDGIIQGILTTYDLVDYAFRKTAIIE